jgi:hypothetical protein
VHELILLFHFAKPHSHENAKATGASQIGSYISFDKRAVAVGRDQTTRARSRGSLITAWAPLSGMSVIEDISARHVPGTRRTDGDKLSHLSLYAGGTMLMNVLSSYSPAGFPAYTTRNPKPKLYHTSEGGIVLRFTQGRQVHRTISGHDNALYRHGKNQLRIPDIHVPGEKGHNSESSDRSIPLTPDSHTYL